MNAVWMLTNVKAAAAAVTTDH